MLGGQTAARGPERTVAHGWQEQPRVANAHSQLRPQFSHSRSLMSIQSAENHHVPFILHRADQSQDNVVTQLTVSEALDSFRQNYRETRPTPSRIL